VPGDGSALDPAQGDLDGVTCNLCHRLVDPIYQPGISPPADVPILAGLTEPPVVSPHGGQYVVDPYDIRRGPFDLGPGFGYHGWVQSPFHLDSRLCGTCHDVSNPVMSRQPDGSYQLNAVNQPHPTQEKLDEFPVERTYSEWTQSDYARRPLDTDGRFGGDKRFVSTCQDCHMPKITGTACIPVLGGAVRPDLPQHNFNGANSWVLSAVLSLYPGQTGMSSSSVAASQARNQAMLAAGSELRLALGPTGLRVRVVNYGGHKLPTGYGEGRRMWLNVRFFNTMGMLVGERGAYDSTTAVLDTSNTRVYELVHGMDAIQAGVTGLTAGPSFHFVLNNEVEKDNRIPPQGFSNATFQAIQDPVVGGNYEDQQYWDDTSFTVPATAVRAEVRLYHQTSSKEYMEFLLNENTTNTAGQTAYNQWVAKGKSSPVQVRLATLDFSAGAQFEPVSYGLAKRLSSGRLPLLSYHGSPSVSGGSLQVTVERGLPNKLAMALYSAKMASTPFQGGTCYVASPYGRTPAITLDSHGIGAFAVPLSPTMIGTVRNYQVLLRDPGDPFGVGLTNALHIEFWP
jgi:hypothetical protein